MASLAGRNGFFNGLDANRFGCLRGNRVGRFRSNLLHRLGRHLLRNGGGNLDGWREIPLARQVDTERLPLELRVTAQVVGEAPGVAARWTL